MTRTRTVAVLNQKGGVGKTTVTLGLASAGAAAGRRVLVVDLDPQASSTWVLGIEPVDSAVSSSDVLHETPLEDAVVPSTWTDLVDVVPAHRDLQDLEEGTPRRLARALDRADLERYEVVLIDCPPSLGSLTTSALAAARHALVVVEPSALGLRGIGAVADSIDDAWDRHNPDLELSGVVLNRVPAVSNEARRRIAELSRIVGRSAVWAPPVPQRVLFAEAIGDRRPIHSYGWRAAEPVEVFDRLWARLRRTVRHP